MVHELLYSQSDGLLFLEDGDGNRALLARGYSGRGLDRDNPASEAKAGRGPIPRGVWAVGRAIHHPRLGPLVFSLAPFGHDAYGRSEFFIHGDNAAADKSASDGCIVIGRSARECISALAIAVLEVV